MSLSWADDIINAALTSNPTEQDLHQLQYRGMMIRYDTTKPPACIHWRSGVLVRIEYFRVTWNGFRVMYLGLGCGSGIASVCT